MPLVPSYLKLIVRFLRALFRSKHEQALIELGLRQQLAIYHRARPRPRLGPIDRAFWVAMRRWSSRWADVLVVVKPETVVPSDPSSSGRETLVSMVESTDLRNGDYLSKLLPLHEPRLRRVLAE